MSNPVIHAFFVGRAIAEVIGENVEDAIANTLSELGKFDAEQRENLRQFTEEVIARAEREVSLYDRSDSTTTTSTSTSVNPETSSDLQQTIDELRAEIARMKSELKLYRTSLT